MSKSNGKPTVTANPPVQGGPVKPKLFSTNSLDEFKSILETNGFKYGPDADTAVDLTALPDPSCSVNDLADEDMEALATASRAHVAGVSALSDGHKSLIENAFGPFTLAVFELEDIDVTPENPWIITGTGPVTVNAGTVTVHPGGQILVQTDATVNIQTLEKVN